MNRHVPTQGGRREGTRLLIGLMLGLALAFRPGEGRAAGVSPPPAAAGSLPESRGARSGALPDGEANAGPPEVAGAGAFDSPRDQMRGDRSIFGRFMAGRDASKTWQTMFEAPVGLFPQAEPAAHLVANEGLNWVTTYQPLNRVYFGRSIGYARMVWQPGGQLDTTEVVQWEWSEILGFALQPWWVMSVGVGVGFMDGLIFYKDGAFKHRLEVFLPVQVGTGVRLGKTWFVGAKLAQSSYFGPGPVASAARALIGIGYNY